MENIGFDSRKRWNSRYGFIATCLCSTISISNILHFPTHSSGHELIIFIIIYFLMSIFFGLSMMILDLSIGQKFQYGLIGSFYSIEKRMIGFGLVSFFSTLVIVGNRLYLLSLVMFYLVKSISSDLSFINEKPKEDSVSLVQVACLIVCLGLCLFMSLKGIQNIEKYFKVALPIILIMNLSFFGYALIYGIKNGFIAIKTEFNEIEFNQFFDTRLWVESLSLISTTNLMSTGIMVAYSSHLSKFQNTVVDSIFIVMVKIIIDFLNSLIFLFLQSTNIEEISEKELGFSFYPFAMMKTNHPRLFFIFFYGSLSLIGISNLIGLFQPILITIYDCTKKFKKSSLFFSIFVVCYLLFLVNLNKIGNSFIGVLLYFVENFINACVGLAECISIGFLYEKTEVLNKIGAFSYNIVHYGNLVCLLALLPMLALELNYYILFSVYLALVVAVIGFGIYKAKTEDYNYVIFGNLFMFRYEMNILFNSNKKYKIPFIWMILIRWFVPACFVIIIYKNLIEYIPWYNNYKEMLIYSYIVSYLLGILVLFFAFYHRYSHYFVSKSDRSILLIDNTEFAFPKPKES